MLTKKHLHTLNSGLEARTHLVNHTSRLCNRQKRQTIYPETIATIYSMILGKCPWRTILFYVFIFNSLHVSITSCSL